MCGGKASKCRRFIGCRSHSDSLKGLRSVQDVVVVDRGRTFGGWRLKISPTSGANNISVQLGYLEASQGQL